MFRCRWCRDVSAGSLTDRRSQPVYPTLALSPIDGAHAPGNHQILQISSWTSSASSELGSDPVAPGVHQRPVGGRRHEDGGPVSLDPDVRRVLAGPSIAHHASLLPDVAPTPFSSGSAPTATTSRS
jgi:hypothetical protein